ncbi:hypothetical protein NN561_000578 [Cricetulus griseus]
MGSLRGGQWREARAPGDHGAGETQPHSKGQVTVVMERALPSELGPPLTQSTNPRPPQGPCALKMLDLTAVTAHPLDVLTLPPHVRKEAGQSWRRGRIGRDSLVDSVGRTAEAMLRFLPAVSCQSLVPR